VLRLSQSRLTAPAYHSSGPLPTGAPAPARQTACHPTSAGPHHGGPRRTETAGQAADWPPPDL